MESNDCICAKLLNSLQKMINSLLTTTGNVMINSNSPATDSGYSMRSNSQIDSQSISNFRNFGNNSIMSTGFYTFMIILALLLIISGIQRRSKSKLKN